MYIVTQSGGETMRYPIVLVLIIFASLLFINNSFARDPRVDTMLEEVSVKSTDKVRGLLDNYGYATTEEQINKVIEQTRVVDKGFAEKLAQKQGWDKDTNFIATIYPHDDHYYTGRLNSLWLPYVKAKRIIIFGVFHKAKWFDLHDKLVFDNHQEWHGPLGNVPISSLRDLLISKLPETNYVIDNDMHMVEHSVEAIVPFLQKSNPEVEIIPILVPYMDFDTITTISNNFVQVLGDICMDNNWILGQDLAFMISSDAIHYGDSQFSKGANMDFGFEIDGYKNVVKREYELINNTLTGQVDPAKLESFLYTCADQDDVEKYKLQWCGRFSVPFGLMVADQFAEIYDKSGLAGTLLDYSTSVEEASLDLSTVEMGTHSPNNLHHWVGYPVIGYMMNNSTTD